MFRRIAAAGLAGFMFSVHADAQVTTSRTTTESKAEADARMARRGAGVTVGLWSLVDDPATGSSTTTDSPIAEGYFRKGLDRHLALETTAGVWRRVIEKPATGGLGGTPAGKTTAILIPQMTSIKLYPFTGPTNTFEPFISAGLGITLGLQSESGSGGLFGSSGGVSNLLPAVGASFATGFEWRFSQAFGLAAGGHYTYIQFFEDLAGERLYRGTGARVGMTYRFQY